MANPDKPTNESAQAPLAPKERRRRRRQARAAAPRPPRGGAERQEERGEERRRKAAQRRRYRQRLKARRPAPSEPVAPAPVAGEPARQPAQRKVRQGIVVSDRADKTIVVRIDVARRHRRYEKIVRSSTTLHAHDERNEAHVGDTVSVVESRPRSRTKRWRLLGVLERAR